jgi:chitin disaccharide deacetylase
VEIVVNADDFGISEDTLAATIECFERGLLTSASVMVGMPGTETALQFARSHPEFSYGVHLRCGGDATEKPVSDPGEVPDLVDEQGRLLPTNLVRGRALRNRIPIEQIERETLAQVEAVLGSGVPVSHVDSHRHLHKFPPFRKALQRALPKLGISRVRNVQDIHLRRPVEHPTYWAGPIWRRALMRSFTTTDHFYMPSTAHDADWEQIAFKLPRRGTLEVGLHPGREDSWRRSELESLAPFVEEVRSRRHDLVGWDAVGG